MRRLSSETVLESLWIKYCPSRT